MRHRMKGKRKRTKWRIKRKKRRREGGWREEG